MEDLLHSGESFRGMKRVDNHTSSTSSTNSSHGKLDVEELEMLLEAYFVQIDGTINKLSAVSGWNILISCFQIKRVCCRGMRCGVVYLELAITSCYLNIQQIRIKFSPLGFP